MPSCWDGTSLDSPNHKSHVSYPSNNNGKCPSTHPVRFITLFYEFLYDVASWDSEWVGGRHPFVLSNGDPVGYSLHADFLNGWDKDILQRAINECNSSSGVIEDCKVLELYTNQQMDDCIVPPSIAEPSTGWMGQLPGCNPIQAGPARATQHTDCGAPTTIGTQQDYSTDMSSQGWKYVGCAK